MFTENKLFLSKHRTGVYLFLLLLITFLVFIPSLHFDFIQWDDPGHLLQNKNTESLSFSNIKSIFQSTVEKVYIPLTIFSFALERHFFDLNPFIYHFNNLLLHLTVTGLIFWLGLRLGLSSLASFLAALLFGIHPMHLESVVWVTERKDVLYGTFYLLAMHQWLSFLKGRRKVNYVLSLVFGLCSLLSKPMAVSLPLILLLLDWFEKRTDTKQCLIEKLPFFIYTIPIAGITHHLNHDVVTFHSNFMTAVVMSLWTFSYYILNFIVPINLKPIYWAIEITPFLYFLGISSFFVIFWLVFKKKEDRWFTFSFMLYAAMIFMLIRFNNLDETDIVADRFMYLPSLGLCFLWGLWCDNLIHRLPTGMTFKKNFILTCLCLIYLCLFISSPKYSLAWENNKMFWKYNVNVCPKVWKTHYNLAQAYLSENNSEYTLKYLNSGLALKQNVSCMHVNRGVEYMKLRKYALAFQDFDQAIEYDPKFVLAYFNRGFLNSKLGKDDLAIADYFKIIDIQPDFYMAYEQIALIYVKNGKPDAALKLYDEAVQKNPNSYKVYFSRGIFYLKNEQYSSAIDDFSRAIQLAPDYKEAYLNRGGTYGIEKKFDLALNDFNKVISLDPNLPDAYQNRSLVYELTGKPMLSKKDYLKYLKLSKQPPQ